MVNDTEDQRLLVSVIGKSNRVCRVYVNMIRLARHNVEKEKYYYIFHRPQLDNDISERRDSAL